MIKTYNYKIEGSNHEGQTWETAGNVSCEFPDVWDLATRASFKQLTDGKAIFGLPGVGCKGPYGVHRVLIQEVGEHHGLSNTTG